MMKHKSSPLVLFLFAILMLSLLITLLNMLGVPNPFYNPFSRPMATPKPVVPPPGDQGGEEQATIDVFKRVSPSVVFIINTEYHRDYFTMREYTDRHGAGSGFVWDHDGHIVTNFHVIQDADSITVTLFDQTAWEGTVIGADPDFDLAVVKIGAPRSRLQPIMAGSSGDLQVGQKVLAIGNPFGLDTTLTVGVISALGRNITSVSKRPIFDVIQTDAAINPGNSGGPLLDSFGRMIGVNTAIYSPSGSSAGIGFSVPIDTVNRIVPQLITRGQIAKPYLGVVLLPEPHRKRFELDTGLTGAVLFKVEARSPAGRAKLQGAEQNRRRELVLGDILVAANNQPIKNNNDLFKILDDLSPGEEVLFRIRRDGQEQDVRIQLGVRSE